MERLTTDSDPEQPCSQCRGTGWVTVVKDSVELASRCPYCSQAKRRSRLLARAEIPKRYRNKGFEDYMARHPRQQQACAIAQSFAKQFPAVDRGLLFVGPCGVGKTHLSVAILQTLVVERLVPARFIDEAELLRRLQYSYGPDSPETEREVMLPLMEIDLLVWDDLGTGRPTEWVRETMRTVINHRYTNNLPTIFTTNWPLEARSSASASTASQRLRREETLSERITNRLYSRLLEMCRVVAVEGIDYRTQISKAAQDSLDERADQSPTPVQAPKPALNVQALLKCPHCQSRQVRQLDSAEGGKGSERWIDLACVCQACGKQFGAKFLIRSGRIEYFE